MAGKLLSMGGGATDSILKNMGRRLTERRKQLRLTQEDVAARWVRIREVEGSNPFGSTKSRTTAGKTAVVLCLSAGIPQTGLQKIDPCVIFKLINSNLWVKGMDIRKTRDFYNTLPPDHVCQCGYCQNYIHEITRSYPLVADYLQSIGIDIEKPFEAIPLEPDEKGYIHYVGVQYIVLGSSDDFKRTTITDVKIDITQSHPSTNIKEEHFVIELSSIYLRWVMEPPQ